MIELIKSSIFLISLLWTCIFLFQLIKVILSFGKYNVNIEYWHTYLLCVLWTVFYYVSIKY